AAELAAGLQAGEPCAVCGSTEHPAPAHAGPADSADALPLDAQTPGRGSLADRERDAQAQHGRAASERQAAEAEVARIEAQLSAARAVAGDDPAATLSDTAEQLGAELAAARRDAGRLTEAEQALAALAARIAEHEQAQRDAAQAEAAVRATHAERGAALSADRARIAAARGDATSVADRAAALRAEADAAEQAAAAR